MSEGLSIIDEYRTFGSLLKNVVDNRGKTCPVIDVNGIPLIATNCISNSLLYPQFEKVRYVSEEVYKKWFREHPLPGDIIFVLKGTPGRVAWVPNPVGFCIAQDMVAIRADESRVYSKYLFAVLRSKTIQQEIEGLHVGSLIPHFKKGDFDDLQIPIIAPVLQKYIGDQYFNISLKIDLLHRQNKTLESIAETIFRQWFIEEAQDEWKEVPLGSLFSISSGKGIKKERLTDEGLFPVLGANGEIGRTNDYLFAEKLLYTGRVGTLGNIFIVNGERVWLSDNTLVLRKMTWFYFIYFSLKCSRIADYNAGSTQPLLRQSDIANISVVMSSDVRLAQFEKYAGELFRKIDANQTQIRTLEKLRDTLLPKLMSGEVRVVS